MWKFTESKKNKKELAPIGSPSLAYQPTGTTVSPQIILYIHCLCPRGKSPLAKKHKVVDPPPSKQGVRT